MKLAHRVIGLTFFACFALTPAAWGWGPGHEDVARETFARLPESIRHQIPPAALKQAIESDCHYPDSFDPFQPDRIGEDAAKKLEEAGLKNRYGLHSDAGRALMFVLLTDAFREHRYDRAALWIAALSHSTADMAALNHDPLVHVMIYSSVYKLKLPSGKPISSLACFDIHDVANDKGPGEQAWQRALASLQLADDGRGTRMALLEIMQYGQQGAAFCSSRGIPILGCAVAWSEQHSVEARENYLQKLSELGAWAVVRTVRDTCAAARLAEAGSPVALTPAIQADFRAWNTEFLHQRKLEDDALFAPILRPLPDQGQPATGVVLEPTWRMNDSMLGYGDRLLTAEICRCLQQNPDHPYATLDLRQVLGGGFPPPSRTPTIIISASSLRDYAWMKVADLDRQLQAYLQQGGRVLWIGGEAKPPTALSRITAAMSRTDKQPLPLPELEFLKAHLRLTGGEDSAYKFSRSPALKTGWHQPLCPWRFTLPATELASLIDLASDDTTTTVGVLWKSADNANRAAFVPIYCLAPYLLTEDGTLPVAAQPRLDAVGQSVLFAALDRLNGAR
jgi:hypothetical protein